MVVNTEDLAALVARWPAAAPGPAAPLLGVPARQFPAGRLLAALLPRLAAGGRFYCIDGGNLFNPYQLTTAARAAGLDPTPLLARVMVSRAYTCHQLVAAVEDLLAEALRRDRRAAAAILGVDRLFLDEDVSLAERRHLFGRILATAERLRLEGSPLVMTFVSGRESPWARQLGHAGVTLIG